MSAQPRCKPRCRTYVPSEPLHTVVPVMIRERRHLRDRLIGGIDLTIDFATLGEYGLEPAPAADAACEGSGQESCGFTWTGWEALAPPRRRGCELPPRCAAAAQ